MGGLRIWTLQLLPACRTPEAGDTAIYLVLETSHLFHFGFFGGRGDVVIVVVGDFWFCLLVLAR